MARIVADGEVDRGRAIAQSSTCGYQNAQMISTHERRPNPGIHSQRRANTAMARITNSVCNSGNVI